jgi:universal stress protein A
MSTVKVFLAPTDLSPLSLDGVRYALDMGASENAEVIVYNVIGYHEAAPYYEFEDAYISEQLPTVAELVAEHGKRLAKFLQDHFADLLSRVKVRQEVAVGTPYQKIVEKAAAEEVDMIVMSTHGRTGFVHALIGSVAEKVVRLAACPVLTVRPKKEAGVGKAAA